MKDVAKMGNQKRWYDTTIMTQAVCGGVETVCVCI